MSISDEFTRAIRNGDVTAVDEVLTQHPELDQLESPLKVSFFMMALYNGEPEAAQVMLLHGHSLTIHEAAAWGDAERLATLVKSNMALVNSFSVDGYQPLGLACFFGHEAAVEILLNSGANVNDPSQNFQQVTPLHSAAASNNVNICHMLLEHNAEVNALQQGGFTPLHAAAQNRNIEMTKLFLEHGAQVNARNAQGLTALTMARESKNEELIRLLIEAGGVE